MATVIDSLTVALGLDPKGFKAGASEAERQVKRTEKTVTDSADRMVSALHRVAAELIGVFLTVRSVQDIVHFFAGLNEQTRQLGIQSGNLGETAAELRDLGRVAELSGGQSEDAARSISGLQQSIQDLAIKGKYSDQLLMFSRIGVDTGAAAHKMRDYGDVLRDTSRRLKELFPTDQARRFYYAQQLGIQGGLANAVAAGPQEFERQFRATLRMQQLTKGDAEAAQRLSQAWLTLKYHMQDIAQRILHDVTPALQRLFKTFGDWVGKHTGQIEGGIDKLLSWLQGPGPGQVIDALGRAAQAMGIVADLIIKLLGPGAGGGSEPATAAGQSGFQVSSEDLKNIDAGGLTGMRAWKKERDVESYYNMPRGFLQSLPAGVEPNQAAEYLASFHQMEGGDKGDPDWQRALGRYSNMLQMQRARAPNPKAGAAARGAGATPAARSRGATTGGAPVASSRGHSNVQIDSMTINTQATDANGIARDMRGALNRKLLATNAEVGLA